MVKLSLDQIYTFSIYNKKTNTYSQHVRKNKLLTGDIEEDVLMKLIRFNELALRYILDIDVPKNENMRSQIESIINTFKTKYPSFLKVPVLKKILERKGDFFQMISYKILKETSDIYIKHGINTNTPDASKYAEIVASNDLNERVNFLIRANNEQYPNFVMYMLTVMLNWLYVYCMKNLNDDQETILNHILCSRIQRPILMNDSYHTILNYINNENNYNNNTENIQQLEKSLVTNMKNQRCLTKMFPMFSIKQDKLPLTSIGKMYDLWYSARNEAKTQCINALGLDRYSENVIPYIFGYDLDHMYRKKEHFTRMIKITLAAIKKLDIKVFHESNEIFENIDELFEFFSFPNRKLCEMKQQKELIVNHNYFDVEKSPLKSLLDKLFTEHVENVVNGFNDDQDTES